MALPSALWQMPEPPLCDKSESQTHLVHFYGTDDSALARNAGRYLWEGFKSAEGLLVIATREHTEAILRELSTLGADPRKAVQDGWLSLLEAKDALASFMIDGEPDWSCFEKTISKAIDCIQKNSGQNGLRAYGDMVGVLWSEGKIPAAIRLEEFWNRLLTSKAFKLFCSYPIDPFGKEVSSGAVDKVLSAHTELVPYTGVSERKAAEEQRLRKTEELVRTNQELQSFAYAAAHDLKEPLRTISACTQLLSRSAQLDDSGRKLAGFVVESAKRMSVLLDDLLSFAGLSADVRLEQIELRQALRQALTNLDEMIAESSATIAAGPLPSIRGHESHLVELFQNLISNSIKYRSEAPVEINISAEQLGHEWIVRIRDNGVGIAPEYHDYVFGLLKRLHGREVPGTGIGLAICKKIVEVMGGRIWVESEPRKGSTFCFTATE